ncbi:hypothetical protein K440DRAFT_661505 [Wilcoxina mikolae CBS 423.85]|nr:hypothetical protein K440DRAFT_661505 [Wilcoxina mikolae CBS 423.85]
MWIPYLRQLAITAIFVASSIAVPTPVAAPKEAPPKTDACAVLASNFNQSNIVTASSALDCLKSVPFAEPQALEFITSLRLFTNFAAHQAYYRSPINPVLEIPEFDINDTISTIESRAKSGYYQNGWEFWREVSLAYTQFRDGHGSFNAVCGGTAFLYWHDYPIVSVRGEIYTITFPYRFGSNSTRTAKLDRKVTHINNQPAVEFLLDMAQTLPDLSDYFDPDTRWNALMWTSVDRSSTFTNRTFWAGEEEEKLQLTFDGGEEVVVEWKAGMPASADYIGQFNDTASFAEVVCYLNPAEYKLYSPTIAGPVLQKDPSGDTFNSMLSSVLSTAEPSTATSGIPQSSSVTTTDIPLVTATATATSTTTSLTGYPTPISRGPEDSLVVFPDPDMSPSVAVLRIPTYEVGNGTSESFPEWDAFLNRTITVLGESGVKRLLIDVSGNGGGYAKLAKRTMRMIFPGSFPGAGHEPEIHFRWRYHSAMVKIFNAVPEKPFSSDYDARGHFRTLQGGNFSSVDDILGPYYNSQVDDYFTSEGIASRDLLAPEDDGVFPSKNYWRAQDIVIISNGLCSSTCHFFVELMEQMGVRSYAIGGRPGHIPMQAVGGTKSGVVTEYTSLVVDSFRLLGDTSNYTDLPKLPATNFRGRTSVETLFRPGSEEIPLFFTFTPACKKVPLTREMATDIRAVWRTVKRLAWSDYGDATGCDKDNEHYY